MYKFKDCLNFLFDKAKNTGFVPKLIRALCNQAIRINVSIFIGIYLNNDKIEGTTV